MESGERWRPHPADSLAGAPKAQNPAQARSDGLERETGIEPATSTLARWRSTAELFPLGIAKDNGGSAGGQAVMKSSAVPPQCWQTRIVEPPNFFSGAHSSQRGRLESWQRKNATLSV